MFKNYFNGDDTLAVRGVFDKVLVKDGRMLECAVNIIYVHLCGLSNVNDVSSGGSHDKGLIIALAACALTCDFQLDVVE